MPICKPARTGAFCALAAMLMGGGLATRPAQAQTLTVIDASGHPVGVIVPRQVEAPPMLDAIDQMMDRELAEMEARQQRMMRLIDQAMPNPAAALPTPALDTRDGHGQASMYQSVTTISWDSNGAPCSQTVTSTSNGRAAPVVQVATRGDAACAAKMAPAANRQAPATRTQDLTPAMDTTPARQAVAHPF
ncbi:hypothetical protein [Komagataeibacter europaeus]|uniref:hypothetical protein n=1 Tax=Komagataeibacter europaeus TaxID=33995 RepID=UPI00030934CF|nr:hypothetical protein [Komagataeibacter europaeus]